MNKTIIVTISTLLFALPVVSQVNAESSINTNLRATINNERSEDRTERKDMKVDIKNIRDDIKQEIEDKVGELTGKMGNVANGEVTAVNGSTFTLTKDGKNITVQTTSTTKITRHFWGVSSIADIKVGHRLNVWGTWTDTNKTTLNAKIIRDLSIVKRFAVIMGTVTSNSGTTIVIASPNRGSQTAITTTSTKIVNRSETTMLQSDIKIGDRIRIAGTWDKTINTMSETQSIKDFSQPVKIKPTETLENK